MGRRAVFCYAVFMRLAALAGVALLSVACATPVSRIRRNKEKFAAYPPEVREGIRAGNAAVGFTPEMVLMALGEPDRKYTQSTANGSTDAWVYADTASGVGVGIGMGSGSGSTVFGGGVSVGGSPQRLHERVRVVFKGDQVISVEKRER